MLWILLGLLLAAGALTVFASLRTPAGQAQGQGLSKPPTRATLDGPIRIAAFNIHSGQGPRVGDEIDPALIANELAGCDIAGLNEVRGTAWRGDGSQAALLGDRLGLPNLFAPTERRWFREDIGNGLICSLPVKQWSRIPLDGERTKGYRNVLLAELHDGRRTLWLAVTHIDNKEDRLRQIRQVSELFAALPSPAVMMGDFNTPRDHPAIQVLAGQPGVVDAADGSPGDWPGRIDYIWVRGMQVQSALVRKTNTSDHPVVIADLAYPPE